MSLVREYFPSDTLKLINQSEGLVVRGGVRGTTGALGVEDKYGAHTIGRHLVSSMPGSKKYATTGSRNHGVKWDEFRDRFLSAPENKSSAWAGKGEMAILLCEMLNSDVGQFALGVLSSGSTTTRVVVHYFNEGKLAGLFGGLAGAATFRESNIIVTPASEALVKVLLTKKDGSAVIDPKTGVQKEIMKKVTTAKSAVADVRAKNIVAVNAVLDRFGGGLHLQTFYPSGEPVTSYAEWSIGSVTIVACNDGTGKIKKTMLPATS